MTVIELASRYTQAEIYEAQYCEAHIIKDARDAAEAFWRLAEHVQDFMDHKRWLPLGYDSFKAWAYDNSPKTYGYLMMHGQAWRHRQWLDSRGETDAAKELQALGPEKVQAILPSLNVLQRREEGRPLKRDVTPEATPFPIQSAIELVRAADAAPQMPEVRAVAALIERGVHVSNLTVPATFFTETQRAEMGMSDPKLLHRKIYLEWSYLEAYDEKNKD